LATGTLFNLLQKSRDVIPGKIGIRILGHGSLLLRGRRLDTDPGVPSDLILGPPG